MRKPPDITPPALETITPRQIDIVQQQREYKLITPLYGGGVTPGEVDPLTPIRGSEIRGHLRFWWRATRGGQFSDMAAMKKEEDAIWGKAYKKEAEAKKTGENESSTAQQTVQIEVTVSRLGESKKALDIVDKRGKLDAEPVGVPEYAVFPLRPPNEDLRRKTQQQLKAEMKSLQHNLEFTLRITYPKACHGDIQAALWAWETLGGIGARTRRGFGALQLLKVGSEKNTNLPASNLPAEVRAWLNRNVQMHVVSGGWPKDVPDVPHLEQPLAFEVVYPAGQVFASWNSLITRYAAFRQLRTKGRAGRSHWPEAEAIREITHRSHYTSLGHPRKFPRAAFGLPIIFHFKDERERNNPDPKDTTLQGAQKGNERLASPLILRPLLCNNGGAVGLAALLKGSVLPSLVLKDTVKPDQLPEAGVSVHAQLNQQDLTRLYELNEQKLKNETNVLQAFLNDLGGRK